MPLVERGYAAASPSGRTVAHWEGLSTPAYPDNQSSDRLSVTGMSRPGLAKQRTLGALCGYGWVALLFGLGGGTCSPVPFLCTFRKYFCAWLRIWMTVLVPTHCSIFFQSRSYSFSASKNFACSWSVQLSRCFVMVYGLHPQSSRRQATNSRCCRRDARRESEHTLTFWSSCLSQRYSSCSASKPQTT